MIVQSSTTTSVFRLRSVGRERARRRGAISNFVCALWVVGGGLRAAPCPPCACVTVTFSSFLPSCFLPHVVRVPPPALGAALRRMPPLSARSLLPLSFKSPLVRCPEAISDLSEQERASERAAHAHARSFVCFLRLSARKWMSSRSSRRHREWN